MRSLTAGLLIGCCLAPACAKSQEIPCNELTKLIDASGSSFKSLISSTPISTTPGDGGDSSKEFATTHIVPGWDTCKVHLQYSPRGIEDNAGIDCQTRRSLDTAAIDSAVASCLGSGWKRTGDDFGFRYSRNKVIVYVNRLAPGLPFHLQVDREGEEWETMANAQVQKAQEQDDQTTQKAQAEQAQSDSLESLSGKWQCKHDYYVRPVAGRVFINGSPTSGRVATTKSSNVFLNIDGISDSSAMGIISSVDDEHLSTQYEFNGYTSPGPDPLLYKYPPACFDVEHNQCVKSATQTIRYVIKTASIETTQAGNMRIVIETYHPSCSGQCPDHLDQAKKFSIVMRKGEDFFSLGGTKCTKE